MLAGQLDMFAAPVASFRDQLLADQPAIGSDGATWELTRWGQKGWQYWGFARTAPNDITVAWINVGIRQHQDRDAAVDDLEAQLKIHGDGWRARDEDRRNNAARVAHDLFRIRCAVPEGWVFADWGLMGGSYQIVRHYQRDAPRSPSVHIFRTDLFNVPGHADRIIDQMAKWVWPPVPEVEDEPLSSLIANDEQLGMAL